MARKTKIDAEKTRSLIIDSAEILFHKKGVSNTSLRDIASYAGLTRGAIYWHFKNKLDLFHAMHTRVMLPLENMQAETLNEPDPVLSLRDFWIRSIQQVLNDGSRRRIIEILFRKCEYVEEFEDAEKRLEKWSCLTIKKMTDIYSDALNKNVLCDGVSPQIAAMATYSFITGLIYLLIDKKDMCEFSRTAPQLITLFFTSLHKQLGETNS